MLNFSLAVKILTIFVIYQSSIFDKILLTVPGLSSGLSSPLIINTFKIEHKSAFNQCLTVITIISLKNGL